MRKRQAIRSADRSGSGKEEAALCDLQWGRLMTVSRKAVSKYEAGSSPVA